MKVFGRCAESMSRDSGTGIKSLEITRLFESKFRGEEKFVIRNANGHKHRTVLPLFFSAEKHVCHVSNGV